MTASGLIRFAQAFKADKDFICSDLGSGLGKLTQHELSLLFSIFSYPPFSAIPTKTLLKLFRRTKSFMLGEKPILFGGSRATKEYRSWRNEVLKRDGFKCVSCGANEHLEVDHIKPWALFPMLRLDVGNGRVLCHDCHKNTDTYLGKLRSVYLKKNPFWDHSEQEPINAV